MSPGNYFIDELSSSENISFSPSEFFLSEYTRFFLVSKARFLIRPNYNFEDYQH